MIYLLDSTDPNRSRFVRWNDNRQLHTFGLLERLRAECRDLFGATSEAYFRIDKLLRELANPNLHDVPTNLPFRVEMWDRQDKGVRWTVAASTNVVIGHAALDTAIATYPSERFTLRNGIMTIGSIQKFRRGG